MYDGEYYVGIDATMKILLITIILLNFFAQNVFGTAQIPDKIIYNGTKCSLQTNPLEKHLESPSGSSLREAIKNAGRTRSNSESNSIQYIISSGRVRSTALLRGYIATFCVTNKLMYLTDLSIMTKSLNENKTMPYVYKSIFKEVLPEGAPLQLNWFSGILVIPHGEMLRYVHAGYRSRFSEYILLEITDGIVTDERQLEYEQFEHFKAQQLKQFQKTKKCADLIAEKTQFWTDYFNKNKRDNHLEPVEYASLFIEDNLFSLIPCFFKDLEEEKDQQ